jgi:hypothetical protein
LALDVHPPQSATLVDSLTHALLQSSCPAEQPLAHAHVLPLGEQSGADAVHAALHAPQFVTVEIDVSQPLDTGPVQCSNPALHAPTAQAPLLLHVAVALGREHGVQSVAAHPVAGLVVDTHVLPQSFSPAGQLGPVSGWPISASVEASSSGVLASPPSEASEASETVASLDPSLSG